LLSANGGRGAARPAAAVRAQQSASFSKVAADLTKRLADGDLIAWGATGGPTGNRRRIGENAWHDILIDEADLSFVRNGRQRLYAIRVHRAADLEELRRGVFLARAAELLVPDALSEFYSKWTPISWLGDPESGRARRAGIEAGKRVIDALKGFLIEGKLQLRTWRPPGDPTGKWSPLSEDALANLHISHESLYAEDAEVYLPDRTGLRVKAFLPDKPLSAQSHISQSPPSTSQTGPKVTVIRRIERIWDAMTESDRAVEGRGAKIRIVRILHQKMSDVPLETLQREFRRFHKSLRGP